MEREDLLRMQLSNEVDTDADQVGVNWRGLHIMAFHCLLHCKLVGVIADRPSQSTAQRFGIKH